MEAWASVAPWLEHLRGRLRVEETEAPHSARRTYAWLQLALPKRRRTTSSEQVREIREALELLAIVAAADVSAWRQLLREKCGVHLGTEEAAAADQPPLRLIFVLDDHTKESILWPAALCNKFFGLLTPVAHSDAFLEAKQSALEQLEVVRRGKLRQHDGEDASAAIMPRIPFCLHFAPKRMGLTSLVQYLNSVHKVIKDLQDKQQTSLHEPRNGKTDPKTYDNVAVVGNNNDEGEDEGEGAPNEPSAAGQSCPFEMDAIQLNLGDFEMSEAVARSVETILATGVDVSCLQLSLCATDFLADDECPRQPLASCYQSIVASDLNALLPDAGGDSPTTSESSSSSPLLETQGGVETLVVHGRDIDDRRFAALCSSLAVARSVSDLVLESVFAQDSLSARKVKWKWLAFALATRSPSHEVCTSLRKLTISDGLLLEADVDAVEAIFRSDYPEMELVDPLWSLEDQKALSATKSARSNPVVHLEKGAIIYTEPVLYPEDWLHNTVVVQHDASFAVMANDPDREWIEILVPGYGKCWVHEEVVKDNKVQGASGLLSNQLERAPTCQTAITSLALAVDVEDDSVLVRLFELMGESLEDVCLNVNTLHDQALDAILTSCPHAKRLVLRGAQLKSLDAVLRAFERSDFHLSSLTLTDFQIDTDSMVAFTRHLSDAYSGHHRISQCLKELCIGQVTPTRVDGSHAVDKDAVRSIIEALLFMVDGNRSTLEFVELHLTPSFFEEFEPQFRARSEVMLAEADGRLRLVAPPLSSRLAFLSVLKARKTCDLLEAHEVVHLILKFASTPMFRHVRVVECE